MVLVQSGSPRPRGTFSRIHPNPARILGVAGAIALNAALFMLLLAPMGGRLPALVDDPGDLIAVQTFKPVQPPKPPPPVTVPVTPPTPAPPVERRVVTPQPVEPAPVLVEQGTPADLSPPPEDTTPVAAHAAPATPPGPVAGVRLEYASAPAPAYPRRELIDRIEGQVLLQVLVDVDGRPLEVTVRRSSGNRELDRAAQQQVLKKWTFRPATRDGRPVQAIGLVPIDFRLQ